MHSTTSSFDQELFYLFIEDIIGNKTSKLIGTKFLISKQNPNFIGRSRNNNINVPDESISKKHAVLQFLHGMMFQIQDLGSKHGTYLNNKKVCPLILKDDVAGVPINTLEIPPSSSGDSIEKNIHSLESQNSLSLKSRHKKLSKCSDGILEVGCNIKCGRVVFNIILVKTESNLELLNKLRNNIKTKFYDKSLIKSNCKNVSISQADQFKLHLENSSSVIATNNIVEK